MRSILVDGVLAVLDQEIPHDVAGLDQALRADVDVADQRPVVVVVLVGVVLSLPWAEDMWTNPETVDTGAIENIHEWASHNGCTGSMEAFEVNALYASHGSGLLELQVSVDTNEAPGSFLPGSSDDSEEVTVQWAVELFEVKVEAASMV